MRAFAAAAALVAAGVCADPVYSQGSISPTVHWGGIFLPDLTERLDVSLSFVGFTRYGKDTVAGGPDARSFRFEPYNDIDRTIGMNLLTVSRNSIGTSFGNGSENVSGGPFTTRSSLSVGVIHDRVTEFLQNNFAHENRLRRPPLLKIPRDPERDVPGQDASVSEYRARFPPLLTFSQEYFLRLYATRDRDGILEKVPTLFYVGGGWAVGTINSEVHAAFGSNIAETRVPCQLSLGVLRSIGVGVGARSGILVPGRYFDDLTSAYGNLQGVIRTRIEVRGYAADVEYALTTAHGFFVAKRSEADEALIDLYAPDRAPTRRYEAKRPVTERFSSLRLRSGGFHFEVTNDSPGGKDKGPSFSAHMGYSFYSPGRSVPLIGRLLDVFSGRDE